MKKIITFVFLITIIVSCQNNCNKVKSIYVSDLLISYTKNKDIKYCSILYLASIGNKESISKLIKLQIYDSAGYDHGNVIVNLIEYLGEDEFIKAIKKDITNKDKDILMGYLKVGIEYNDKYKSKKVKDIFPKVYYFITNSTHNNKPPNSSSL